MTGARQQKRQGAGTRDEEPEAGDRAQKEHRQAEKRTAIGAQVVHEAISLEGEDELKRPSAALAWSALAAGLSMGFSLVAEGLIHSMLPDVAWRPLLSKFGYCVGFVIVVLGRQQLFTENTLTVILPLLHRRDVATARNVARLWTVVLLGNLLGGLAFAWVVGHTEIFDPAVRQVFSQISQAALGHGLAATLWRGVFAGWLIALMVWLLPVAEASRVLVIILITYVVGLGGFSHIVAGSTKAFYLTTTGVVSWSACLRDFMLPTFVGNVVGGVALVAMLNHAQVVAGGGEDI